MQETQHRVVTLCATSGVDTDCLVYTRFYARIN